MDIYLSDLLQVLS